MTNWQITTTPLAHQCAALAHLQRSRVGAFFMEMGTGKSWLRSCMPIVSGIKLIV